MNNAISTVLNWVGFTTPIGMVLVSFLKQINPILQALGLLVSIGVGVTVIVLNIVSYKKKALDLKIDEMILKHPEIKDKNES